MTIDEFIAKAKAVHGDEYDLSKTIFKSWNEKIIVTCYEHGDFEISPRSFIYKHHGCSKCRGKHISQSQRKTQEQFLKECHEIHGDKYDYSKAIYTGIDNEVEIICPIHGSFFQTPYNHINKRCGCSKCRYDMLSQKYRLPIDELKQRIASTQGERYEYPYLDQEYVNNRSEITIICPIHGEFQQKVMKHLYGHGCPKCQQSKMEKEMEMVLQQNSIKYVVQQKFEWLRLNKPLSLDFYLPQYNLAIECQGEQHFHSIKQFGGKEEFEKIQQRDQAKLQLCKEHNIPILYFSHLKDLPSAYLSDIYINKEDLLEEIYRHGTKQRNTGIIQDSKNTVGSTNTLGTAN